MTPLSLSYLLIGALAMLFPILLIFGKREVLMAQWALTADLTLFAISMVLYSTLFNTFLQGEYLLVILFFIFSLSTPLMTYAALHVLLNPRGIERLPAWLVAPPVLLAVLLIASVIMGGGDMYQLWISRGAVHDAGLFYPASNRYNIIVGTHYYLFWAVLMYEIIYVIISGVRQLRTYRRLLAEYYAASSHSVRELRGCYYGLLLMALAIGLSYAIYPFNVIRPTWVAWLTLAIEGGLSAFIGWNVNHIHYGAERLPHGGRIAAGHSGSIASARRIVAYIEQPKVYLDPDLSVPLLAHSLHLAEDDIIDAVHRVQGTSFGEYIEGLRIDHAVHLMGEQPWDLASPTDRTRLAHLCGYLDAEAFAAAYSRLVEK